jgi:hypothetical protein
MSALTEKTLSMITQERIRPLPRWRTWGKNAGYWIGTGWLFCFAALSAALSLHAAFEIDWRAYFKADFSWWEIVLSGVPLFSIGLLTVFLLGALWFLQRTQHGYRYSFLFLFLGFFSLSTALGFLIENSPIDEPAEQFFLYALPHAEEIESSLLPSAERQWSQPEQGLLGGTVLSSDDQNLKLLDASQKLWTVDYSQALLSPSVDLEPYEDVKIIGDQEDETLFRAVEIEDWERTPARVIKKQQDKDNDVLLEQDKEEEDDNDSEKWSENEENEERDDNHEEEEKETSDNHDD